MIFLTHVHHTLAVKLRCPFFITILTDAWCSAEMRFTLAVLGPMPSSGLDLFLSSKLITDDIAEHFGMIGAIRAAAQLVVSMSKLLNEPTEEEKPSLTNRPYLERYW